MRLRGGYEEELFEVIVCDFEVRNGVAMGSPLAPVLANLFMGHHEMKWLDTFPSEILAFGVMVPSSSEA